MWFPTLYPRRRNSRQVHRPRLALERVEARDCPSVTAFQIGGALSVVGNAANDVVTIRDHGLGKFEVTAVNAAGNQTTKTFTGVGRLAVSTGAGSDNVTFIPSGDQIRAIAISINTGDGPDKVTCDNELPQIGIGDYHDGSYHLGAALGPGADVFELNPAFFAGLDWSVNVNSGLGADRINATMSAGEGQPPDNDRDANFTWNVINPGGDDSYTLALGGPDTRTGLGQVAVGVTATSGNNTIIVNFKNLDVAGTTTAQVRSGGGADNCTVMVADVNAGKPMTVAVFTGTGNDAITLNARHGVATDDPRMTGRGSTIQELNARYTLRGNDGADQITVQTKILENFTGQVALSADGGAGSDTMSIEAVSADTKAIGLDFQLRGAGGNDKLTFVDPSPESSEIFVPRPVKLEGGAGNDLLTGGGADDQLFGNWGHDTLDGGGGKDQLDGGDGNDQLDGQGGSDFLIGGAGDDHLFGGANDDYLLGGTGLDVLEGNGGNDMLIGGKLITNWLGFFIGYGDDGIKDVLIGGLGADEFYVDSWGDITQPEDAFIDLNPAEGDEVVQY